MAKHKTKEIDVYSKEYDIHGVVKDYGVVTKLFFNYEGKEIVMGIDRNPLKGEKFEDIGRNIIESYVKNLAVHENGRKLQFHYWYIDEHEVNGVRYLFGHGVVTGHTRLEDATFIHTSAVRGIHVDKKEGEVVLTTKNSVYHCPLEYCRFDEQDKYPGFIPDYDDIKKKYADAIKYPTIEPGKVLLVLSNFCEYYFHSVYYVPEEAKEKKSLEYSNHAHIGMFQDSYLVNVRGTKIDLAYFPHYQNIEFYGWGTDGLPFYIENIGDVTLYAKTNCGTIRIEPGKRRKVCKRNAEKAPPLLPDGDLYPAGIIE